MATNTASFLRPGLQTPYEGEANQLGMEQQLLAQRLMEMEQAKNPSPINAGKFATLDFSSVGNAINEVSARKKLEIARKKMADVQGAYQKNLVTSLRAYSEDRDGKTVDLQGPPEDGQTGVTGQVPPNPQAYKQGQLSPYPEVRSAAEEDRKGYEAIHKELLKKASFSSAQTANGSNTGLRAAPDVIPLNGALVQKPQELGQPASLVPGTGVTQETLPSGTVVNKFFGGKADSVDKAPHTNISLPGTKADTKFLETEAEQLSKRRETLQTTAPGQFRALASAEQAANSGALQGPVSGLLQTAGSVLQEFGMAPESARELLKNTEVLNSDMGRFVLSMLKATGTNPSNSDREYAERTAGGQKLTPDGFRAVVRAARVDILNNLIEHNKHVDRLVKAVPSVEIARLSLPEVSNVAPGAKGVPRGTLDISGFDATPEGTFMPRPRDKTAPAKSAPAKYTPEQVKKMQDFGYTPQGH